MVARRKKKYESGQGAQYMSRKTALKYLQLTLKDFRRLCIFKGIYPREPRNRKKAQKGSTHIQTLYHKKDIQFLQHEPIIWKIRDLKVFCKKMGRARGLKDVEAMKIQLNNHPILTLDHIVKERYPTFIDALQDLDDCLTLCFLFSTFPSLRHVPKDQSALCRRLTIEFLHGVIQAKALRKVFVSIKGYYYQVEFLGQTITWITPHHFAFQPQHKNEVDFRIMATFVQFYTVMLGFVNYHMYHKLNLIYPPKLSGYGTQADEKSLVDEGAFVSERIAALNLPICKMGNDVEEEQEIDSFPELSNESELEEKKSEILKIQTLKNLFRGLKFFVNREVPREPIVFMIRCFGGTVSWDKLHFVGATFDESDATITHQVIDRPSVETQYLSRYYIQPQWIFDSVNARELLPVEKYLMGAVLPPHLSPFINPNRDQAYVPPEERALKEGVTEDKSQENEDESEDEVEEAEGGEKEEKEMEHAESEENKEDESEDEKEAEESSDLLKKDEETNNSDKMKGMSVNPGEVYKADPVEKRRQEKHEFYLREKMISKRHRKLYKSMRDGQKKRAKESWLLRKKRRLIDASEKEQKKEAKKNLKAQKLSDSK